MQTHATSAPYHAPPLAAPARLAASSAAGASNFFRFHGIWAPGVRLFRAIGFRAKAGVISLVFCVPIVVLAWFHFGDKAAAIAFSAKERDGVAYNRELLPLIPALQRQRQVALTEVARRAPDPAMADARAAVEAALVRLAAVEARFGTGLGTGKAYTALRQSLEALPPHTEGLAKVAAGHDQIADRLLALLATATDNSNLTLDPDLDTYYLMDGALGSLPQLLEATARLRGLSSAVAFGAPATEQALKQAGVQEIIGDVADERFGAALDKVYSVHPDLREVFGSERGRRQLHAFHETAGSPSASGEKIVAAGDEAIEALFVLQGKMLEQLDTLLSARVGRLQAERDFSIMVLVVSLALVLYLFVSFQKVLDGGLREVAHHLGAMRDGDLTTAPQPWGSDEAARLMQSLAEMQDSLCRIVGRVRSASDHIVHSSAEIAAGANDLSSRTEQSAANLEESASAMEEIAATVKQTADNAGAATALARANAVVAERGGEIIATMVRTMEDIQTSSHRIGDIVGTIDGIAFQTNILALNAAVEAARAGDAGRGFAVVASEVRQLAQRSAGAAREIKSLITASVDKVESGTAVVREAGVTIREIVDQARRVDQLLADIASGAKEQAAGVGQTTQAVHEMDTTTQQNAALVEQTAAAAASLKDQARALADEVALFKLP